MLQKAMIERQSYLSKSEDDTKKFAQQYAEKVACNALIALHGDLGTGKSVFCRAFIQQLLNDPALNVPSPTFSLLQTYEKGKTEIWHFDLYRLEDAEEVYELGWEDALMDKITLIEWPDIIDRLLPDNTIHIYFRETSETEREIKVIT